MQARENPRNPPENLIDTQATRVTSNSLQSSGNNQFDVVSLNQSTIPNPEVLDRYNEMVPGAADRLLKMAEREQKSQIWLKRGDWLTQFLSVLLGKGFLWLLAALTYLLAINGKPYYALLTGITPIGSVIYRTFFGGGKKE